MSNVTHITKKAQNLRVMFHEIDWLVPLTQGVCRWHHQRNRNPIIWKLLRTFWTSQIQNITIKKLYVKIEIETCSLSDVSTLSNDGRK